MRESEKRSHPDRRKQPTPIFSRYSLWGRRKGLRRKADQGKGGYVDRYSSSLLFFLILTVGLNVLDSFFTMIILDCGGWEVNPIVQSAMEVYGDHFWVWKFAVVSLNVTLLCLHSKFRYVQKIIPAICFVYLAVVLYQIVLMTFQ